LSALENLNTGG